MSGVLNHSPADVARRALIQLGVGADPSFNAAGAYTGSPWPIFAAGEPDKPDSAITVRDTTGRSDGRSMIDGESWEHYGLQFRVRAAAHTTGYAKANALARVLDTAYLVTVTIGTARYLVHCFSGRGNVLDIGKEVPSSKRSLFTLNALVALKKVN